MSKEFGFDIDRFVDNVQYKDLRRLLPNDARYIPSFLSPDRKVAYLASIDIDVPATSIPYLESALVSVSRKYIDEKEWHDNPVLSRHYISSIKQMWKSIVDIRFLCDLLLEHTEDDHRKELFVHPERFLFGDAKETLENGWDGEPWYGESETKKAKTLEEISKSLLGRSTITEIVRRLSHIQEMLRQERGLNVVACVRNRDGEFAPIDSILEVYEEGTTRIHLDA